MLGKFERCECELEPFVRVDGAFERAESWPSRTSRGSPSTPAPGVRCKGAGRPLSNRLPGTLLREMGDGKVIVSLPLLPRRPWSVDDGLLMIDESAAVE